MTSVMSCAQVEELLSEHHEGSLVDPLRGAVISHLQQCAACSELLEALSWVVEALRDQPTPAPSPDLAERAATAALAQPRRVSRLTRSGLSWPARLHPLPLAAALAIAVTGALMLAGPGDDALASARRMAERSVPTREYLLERKDRLVEDIRLLRVVIGTAFEGRLDRVNERVDDYRRLLERKRAGDQDHQHGEDVSSSYKVLSARGPGNFQNLGPDRLVGEGVWGAARS